MRLKLYKTKGDKIMEKNKSSLAKTFTLLAFVFFIASIISFEISTSRQTVAKAKQDAEAKAKEKDADVYEMLELFYILCDLKYVIDTTVANKINDFYKLYVDSLYDIPILNIHKLRNKSILIAKIMDIIKDLRFKEKELLDFNIAHINFKHIT